MALIHGTAAKAMFLHQFWLEEKGHQSKEFRKLAIKKISEDSTIVEVRAIVNNEFKLNDSLSHRVGELSVALLSRTSTRPRTWSRDSAATRNRTC